MIKKFCGLLKDGQHIKIFDTDNGINLIDFFIFPDVSNSKKYKTGGISCLPDEWDYVELNNTQKESMLGEYLKSISQTCVLNKLTTSNYNDIKTLYLIDSNKIIFSQITKRQIIKDQKFINVRTGSIEIVNQDDSINFDGQVHAYYDGNNKIYFKSFSIARTFFGVDFLTAFYEMVSESEAKTFFTGNNFFTTGSDISKIDIGTRNRTLISYIQKKGIDFDDITIRQKYTDYAKRYPKFGVKISLDNKFEFDKPSDITNILHVLEERIYKTEVTGEERIAKDIENIN